MVPGREPGGRLRPAADGRKGGPSDAGRVTGRGLRAPVPAKAGGEVAESRMGPDISEFAEGLATGLGKPI